MESGELKNLSDQDLLARKHDLQKRLRELDQPDWREGSARSAGLKDTRRFEQRQTKEKLLAVEHELERRTLDKQLLEPRKNAAKRRKPTRREATILELLSRRGREYAKALDDLGQNPKKEWVDRRCPGTHLRAYLVPEWRKRIQDEKTKVRRRFQPKP